MDGSRQRRGQKLTQVIFEPKETRKPNIDFIQKKLAYMLKIYSKRDVLWWAAPMAAKAAAGAGGFCLQQRHLAQAFLLMS